MADSTVPTSLAEAIAQARAATRAALDDGLTRLQAELVFPELKALPVATQFLPVFADWGDRLKVFFPDAGAAALARREWGEVPFRIADIGSGRTPLAGKVEPEDGIFLFVEPSDVEVNLVEELCQQMGDRPAVFLNPRLENVATIGIGYAGRQLRERFLSTIETVYHLRPMEGMVMLRAYPSQWQVWLEPQSDAGAYELAGEAPQKPVGDELDRLLGRGEDGEPVSRAGFLSQMQQFFRALSQ